MGFTTKQRTQAIIRSVETNDSKKTGKTYTKAALITFPDMGTLATAFGDDLKGYKPGNVVEVEFDFSDLEDVRVKVLGMSKTQN